MLRKQTFALGKLNKKVFFHARLSAISKIPWAFNFESTRPPLRKCDDRVSALSVIYGVLWSRKTAHNWRRYTAWATLIENFFDFRNTQGVVHIGSVIKFCIILFFEYDKSFTLNNNFHLRFTSLIYRSHIHFNNLFIISRELDTKLYASARMWL